MQTRWVSESIQTLAVFPRSRVRDGPSVARTLYPLQSLMNPSIILFPAMLSQQTPLSFPLIEDCIGEESCVDLMPPLPARPNDAGDEVAATQRSTSMRRSRQSEMKEKEYPPPIPLLARTENLHSHMPWVLERTYTDDGRLILREERVRHHEYFLAHRRDGRLTLQLVPLDDEVFELEDECDAEPDADSTSSPTGDSDNGDNRIQCSDAEMGNGKDSEDPKADDADTECRESAANDGDEPEAVSAVEIGGGIWKCLKVYNMNGEVNGSGGSSCVFGGAAAVPALGPVRG